MSTTINGDGLAVQSAETIRFTPRQAGEYGGKWTGPKAKVKLKLTELINAGWACQYECDSSPVATLSFNTPSGSSDPAQPPANPNTDYVDNWQVIRNTTQKELMLSDHPILALITNIEHDSGGPTDPDVLGNLDMLKLWMANNQGGASKGSPDFLASDDALPSQVAAQYIWDLWSSGARSVEIKQPILRVTRVTNPLYDAPFDLSKVDRLLLTATMIADSNVPSNFAIELVTLAAKLWNRAVFESGQAYIKRADTLILKYGWLKDVTTLETVGTTKNQYVIEYKFGLYDVGTYGEPI